MGVLTSFVALTPDDADRVDVSSFNQATYGEWAVDGRGLFDVELAALEEVLTGRELFEILAAPADLVAETPDAGATFRHLGPEVVNMLADRAGGDWLPTAQMWTEYEELEGADPADLQSLLVELADLAGADPALRPSAVPLGVALRRG